MKIKKYTGKDWQRQHSPTGGVQELGLGIQQHCSILVLHYYCKKSSQTQLGHIWKHYLTSLKELLDNFQVIIFSLITKTNQY